MENVFGVRVSNAPSRFLCSSTVDRRCDTASCPGSGHLYKQLGHRGTGFSQCRRFEKYRHGRSRSAYHLSFSILSFRTTSKERRSWLCEGRRTGEKEDSILEYVGQRSYANCAQRKIPRRFTSLATYLWIFAYSGKIALSSKTLEYSDWSNHGANNREP